MQPEESKDQRSDDDSTASFPRVLTRFGMLIGLVIAMGLHARLGRDSILNTLDATDELLPMIRDLVIGPVDERLVFQLPLEIAAEYFDKNILLTVKVNQSGVILWMFNGSADNASWGVPGVGFVVGDDNGEDSDDSCLFFDQFCIEIGDLRGLDACFVDKQTDANPLETEYMIVNPFNKYDILFHDVLAANDSDSWDRWRQESADADGGIDADDGIDVDDNQVASEAAAADHAGAGIVTSRNYHYITDEYLLGRGTPAEQADQELVAKRLLRNAVNLMLLSRQSLQLQRTLHSQATRAALLRSGPTCPSCKKYVYPVHEGCRAGDECHDCWRKTLDEKRRLRNESRAAPSRRCPRCNRLMEVAEGGMADDICGDCWRAEQDEKKRKRDEEGDGGAGGVV